MFMPANSAVGQATAKKPASVPAPHLCFDPVRLICRRKTCTLGLRCSWLT